MKLPPIFKNTTAIVWTLRIVVGGLFVMSGLVKAIDLWGFIYKIEEYLHIWGIEQPRSLCLTAALGLSAAEFLAGLFLLVGAYKRVAVWLITAMMLFMLPLTLYIFIANPVPDCGCFGDFLKISNGATFFKNLLISAALIYLWKFNTKVRGVFDPYIQWLVAFVCFVYIIFVGLFGYMIQPLIDFRSFPVGSSLLPSDNEVENVQFEFIYTKDGLEKAFTADCLPDSTWTFVDRRQISGSIAQQKTDFVIFDSEIGDDVTEDVILDRGNQLIIVIPEYSRASVAYTYAVNEMARIVRSHDGDVVEVANIPNELIAEWHDLSMADYDIYISESTVLKELARGEMAAVYLKDGVIKWKRSLSSIDASMLNDKISEDAMMFFAFSGSKILWKASLALLVSLLLIFGINKGVNAIKKKHAKAKS